MHFVSNSQRKAVFSRLSGLGKLIAFSGNHERNSDAFHRHGYADNFFSYSNFARKPSVQEMLDTIYKNPENRKSAEKSMPKAEYKMKYDSVKFDNFTPGHGLMNLRDMLKGISEDSSRPEELRRKSKEEVERMDLIIEMTMFGHGDFDLFDYFNSPLDYIDDDD